MASNKVSVGTSEVNRGKISRNNIKEKRQDRLNYYNNSHVTNNNVREKTLPGHEDTFIVPEILCQCQQKCTERITAPLIQKVSMYFFGMRHDKRKQYRYLADLILSKEKKFDLADIVPGKRLRKMSFRYFVPIITDSDLKLQVKETSKTLELGNAVNGANVTQINGGAIEDDIDSPKRDHIEVCLKAFTNIHLISEKRVNITRSSCKLKNSIYCTRPLPIHGSSLAVNANPVINNNSSVQPSLVENSLTANSNDISIAAIAWLSNHCQQKKPAYAINPKTLLPEGLVLPDSVTCLPVYPQPQYDINRDAIIVDNFFNNQLWKPEYTGGIQEN